MPRKTIFHDHFTPRGSPPPLTHTHTRTHPEERLTLLLEPDFATSTFAAYGNMTSHRIPSASRCSCSFTCLAGKNNVCMCVCVGVSVHCVRFGLTPVPALLRGLRSHLKIHTHSHRCTGRSLPIAAANCNAPKT